MWNDRVRLCESVVGDWKALSVEEKASAMQALEALDEDPISGVPLFEPLRGVWSRRAGHLRILYRIAPEARIVLVLSIARAPAR